MKSFLSCQTGHFLTGNGKNKESQRQNMPCWTCLWLKREPFLHKAPQHTYSTVKGLILVIPVHISCPERPFRAINTSFWNNYDRNGNCERIYGLKGSLSGIRHPNTCIQLWKVLFWSYQYVFPVRKGLSWPKIPYFGTIVTGMAIVNAFMA